MICLLGHKRHIRPPSASHVGKTTRDSIAFHFAESHSSTVSSVMWQRGITMSVWSVSEPVPFNEHAVPICDIYAFCSWQPRFSLALLLICLAFGVGRNREPTGRLICVSAASNKTRTNVRPPGNKTDVQPPEVHLIPLYINELNWSVVKMEWVCA